MSAPNNEESLELTFTLVKFNFKHLPEILETMLHSSTLGLLIRHWKAQLHEGKALTTVLLKDKTSANYTGTESPSLSIKMFYSKNI